ncbi:MAG: HD domain-containing protein [Candidatus Staskawiczbacteria bacterium]|nr:HD domain-containing protein [Candidatus Staskawiczbacteria bacterium]
MLIPKEIKSILEKLQKAGFEAYIVGGCARDFLLEREPKDWDITTNAKPEEIQKIFPDSFYENSFLTVSVRTGSKNAKLREIEITTYRSEAKYSDKRHPDQVKFAKTLEEDLARRDFTINAIAIDLKINKLRNSLKIENCKLKIVDPFGGQEDLKNKTIRAVGNAEERFNEDALRMMRAVRFAATLNFEIEKNTAEAIKKNSPWMKEISEERIRDEFLKIIMSERAAEGVEILRELGLLKHIIPELEEGFGVSQNKHHIYDCYQHLLKSLEYAVKKKFNLHVRLAALFHDIAKPRVKRGEGEEATFYNHEIVGAKMTFSILNRLKFPKKDVEKISKLVKFHLFYYNVGEVSESSVRRLVKNVGSENIDELLEVRQADRIGSGVPKAEPYKLRHLKYIIEKISKDPISAKMLKINGDDIMKLLKIKPGPKVGHILDILLKSVIDDPEKNKKEFLEKETVRLGNLSDRELEKSAQGSKEEIEKIETKKDQMTKEKYWVT